MASPPLLGANNYAVEVCKHNSGSQPAELPHELHEELLHEVVHHSAQCRLKEKRRGRAQPTEEVNQLKVCKEILVSRDLMQPRVDHTLHDPGRGGVDGRECQE